MINISYSISSGDGILVFVITVVILIRDSCLSRPFDHLVFVDYIL
jgi:hypothetical protein